VNRGLKIISSTERIEDNDLYRTQSNVLERKGKNLRGQRMLRVREAATYLGSSPWKVRQLIAKRRIPFFQDGDGPFLVDIRDLDGFIERTKRTV
jgi:excisionase family DNA binding protein